jgi:hypothetical protein
VPHEGRQDAHLRPKYIHTSTSRPVVAAATVALVALQLSLLPVVAHHRGTYFSYLHCWYLANKIWDNYIQHLLVSPALVVAGTGGGKEEASAEVEVQEPLIAADEVTTAVAARAAWQVFSLDAGQGAEDLLLLLSSWGSPLAAVRVGSSIVPKEAEANGQGSFGDAKVALDHQARSVPDWLWPNVAA